MCFIIIKGICLFGKHFLMQEINFVWKKFFSRFLPKVSFITKLCGPCVCILILKHILNETKQFSAESSQPFPKFNIFVQKILSTHITELYIENECNKSTFVSVNLSLFVMRKKPKIEFNFHFMADEFLNIFLLLKRVLTNCSVCIYKHKERMRKSFFCCHTDASYLRW